MKYFTLFISLMIFSCSTQPKDCTKFKTGTFKYANSDYDGVIVTRNDTIQIEINEKNNSKIIGSIEWVSDCKYILTYKEAVNLTQNNLIGKQVEVEITQTNNNGYKCIASDGSISLKVEMIKIE